MNACLGVGGVGEELGRFGRGEQRIEMVYNHVCCFRGRGIDSGGVVKERCFFTKK